MKSIFQMVVLAAFFGCSAKTPEIPSTPAPGKSATVVSNDSIPFPVFMSYSELEPYLNRSNDTTYVVNFWATWCKPCVEELPLFEKLISTAANPSGVSSTGAGKPIKVLLVSMDFPKDILKKLVPFVVQRNLEPHVVALADMDYNAWIDKVSTAWDGAIPFTLVYSKKGRLVKSGEMANYEELEKLVAGVEGL